MPPTTPVGTTPFLEVDFCGHEANYRLGGAWHAGGREDTDSGGPGVLAPNVTADALRWKVARARPVPTRSEIERQSEREETDRDKRLRSKVAGVH